jgi:hypothetical protein
MRKKPKPPRISPTQVANVAGCSRALADRLLRRGMTPAEIVERIAAKKRQKTALVDAQTNGHAAAIPPFAVSQAKKEAALADLRAIEVGERTGALVAAEQTRQWIAHLYTPLIQGFRALPAELRDSLPPGTAELLDRRIEGIIRAADLYLESCFRRGGQSLSDGSLDCGSGYKVRWWIEPPPVPPVKNTG